MLLLDVKAWKVNKNVGKYQIGQCHLGVSDSHENDKGNAQDYQLISSREKQMLLTL